MKELKEQKSVERLPQKRQRASHVSSEPIVYRPPDFSRRFPSMQHPVVAAAEVQVKLLEPCFVNPSSLAEVKQVLRHLGEVCGVEWFGGKERQWLSVTCDGVPFWLMLRAIHEARDKSREELYTKFGWVFVDRLTVSCLKDELRRRHLPLTGTKDMLKARLYKAVNMPLEEKLLAAKIEAEFDWVVPCAGGQHKEFVLCRSLIDVNWHVTYHAFALTQGYKG